MCLTIPGKVTKIQGNIATIDYDGIQTKAITTININLGDTVIVQNKMIVEKLKND